MLAWDDWLLMTSRAAIHRATATAVVADLHLGYAAARRRAGEAVPTPMLTELLAPLETDLLALGVRSLVVAGDLFEAGPDEASAEQLLAWSAKASLRVIVVPGNHDRGLRNVPEALRPVSGSVLVGDWRVIHGDGGQREGRVVQGHVHPAVHIARGVRPLPCFLAAPGHLVLPAFSVDAAGVDVRGEACWKGYRCFAIAGGSVIDAGPIRS